MVWSKEAKGHAKLPASFFGTQIIARSFQTITASAHDFSYSDIDIFLAWPKPLLIQFLDDRRPTLINNGFATQKISMSEYEKSCAVRVSLSLRAMIWVPKNEAGRALA